MPGIPPKITGKVAAAWLALFAGQAALAAEIVHQAPGAFLEESLPGCEKKALWLKSDMKAEIEEVLDRPFPAARVRYCAADGRTAWILDEIGKTEPITTGIVVENERVERVRVLVFRESRGGEVHREAFVRQYHGATMDRRFRLDQPVDGITGATMSVDALNKQVRLALLLDRLAAEGSRDH
jgi:hypothetical protein